MTSKLRQLVFLTVLLFCLLQALTVRACSLALHDWKLVFYIKIPVSSPFFPLSELNAATLRLEQSKFSSVYWVAAHSQLSSIASIFLPLFQEKAARLPWLTVSAGPSLLSFAREHHEPGQGPLIVGSDQCFVKIALFADKNSRSNCYQLVVLQGSRIRAVHPDTRTPWAQEINGQSWLSLIFHQLPVPGRILSFSVYPVQKSRHSIYEDHSFVELLLSRKLLMRRPDLVVDPYTFDFPELPE